LNYYVASPQIVPNARALRSLGIQCSCRSLGRNFFITAKLQKIIRITVVDWPSSSAQLAQSRMLGVV